MVVHKVINRVLLDFSQFRSGHSGGISSGRFISAENLGSCRSYDGFAGESTETSIFRDGAALGNVLQAVPISYRIHSVIATRYHNDCLGIQLSVIMTSVQ